MKKFQNFEKNNEIIAASDAFFPFVDGIETSLVQSISNQPSAQLEIKK